MWTAWKTKNGDFKVGRLTEDGWQALPGKVSRIPGSQTGWPLAVAADLEGDVWSFADDNLYHHDDDRWHLQSVPTGRKIRGFDVGPDGTVWVRFASGISPKSILARFDGTEWTVYDESFDIPSMGDHFQGLEGWFEVASNGSVWFDPIGDWERTGTECDGVANFDGESLTYYLRDICIYAMDIGQDGRVWLQAGENRADVASGQSLGDVRPGPIHTYVITPEAVAGAE